MCFIIEYLIVRATFIQYWVRKLIGKPVADTTPDCEFDARRIHQKAIDYEACVSFRATESNALRIQSDLLCGDLAIAACISFASNGVKRAENTSPLAFLTPTLGRPSFFFIIIVYKYVDTTLLFVYINVNKENDMANKLQTEKKVTVISMLPEGSSIRSIERITGVNRNTIMNLGLRVGNACKRIMDEKMRGLSCAQIEVDEIWGFIGAKRKNADKAGVYDDVWTFIALDSETKLIPSFTVGKRDAYHARVFMADLAGRLSRRVQLSSDALHAYPEAVERGFGSEVDYGQLVKTYSVTNLGSAAAAVRYSPAEVVKTERTVINGMPDIRRITTSHVEKQNHTLRMHCRRLTHLTNAFSKKFENFEAAVALNFAYYNFCKTHCALKMTPAMAAGIANTFWTVEDLVKLCGE
jgi:IS1 family transposase